MAAIPDIPESELEFTYVRSSGPGGQNVNKVNSKAVLRWSIPGSKALTDAQRAFLTSKLSLTVAGDLVIASDRYRDQARNKEDCLQKLWNLLHSALRKSKVRRKTKPTRSSQLKRKQTKKRHSEKKAARTFKGGY